MENTGADQTKREVPSMGLSPQGICRLPVASTPKNDIQAPSFTVRSVGLGFLSGLFIAAFSYYNDYGIKQNLFVGNHLPLTVYSALFLFLLLVNPVLNKFSSSLIFTIAVSILYWGVASTLAILIQSWIPLLIVTPVFLVALVGRFILRVNPLRPFSSGELAVTLSMSLVACSLPTSGLMRYLPQILVMPQYFGKSISDWEKAEPDRYVSDINPNIFPQHDENGNVYDGYVQGLSKTGKQIDLPPLRDVLYKVPVVDPASTDTRTPLGKWLAQGGHLVLNYLKRMPLWAWWGPLKVWLPLLIVAYVFIISMCRIVHRQWSENEQLSYPIAEFAHSLLRNDCGRAYSDVFYSRQFWIAFSAVFLIHINNGWYMYDPRLIKIPLTWNMSTIWYNNFSYFQHAAGWTNLLFAGTLYVTVVAFAYFLPQEVSLSLGLSLPLFVLLTATMYQFGRPVNGQEQSFMLFGSYVAMAGVIFYTGRYYYISIIKRAFLMRSDGEADASAVAACRWFVGSGTALILIFCGLGLDWLLAVMAVFVIGVMFLVLARASAETGIPFMGTPFFARGIITGLLGTAAVGPANMYLLQLVTVATMQDNRECLAPYVINNFRLGSRNNVKPAPLSRAMMAILVPGIVVAGIAMLWVIYSRGATVEGLTVPFAGEISRDIQKLKRTGMLEKSTTVSGLARLSSDVRDTSPGALTFFAVGIGLVLINSMLRLRYVWWPLHPVLFLFWNVWATNNFVWSFMIGWLIKMLVVKIGGGRVYQNLKPLFIGLIIGDLCGGMFWIVFGVGYYFWTGTTPLRYGIFPG